MTNFISNDLFPVFSSDYTITCRFKDGVLSFISVGTLLNNNNVNAQTKTIRDLCLDIIAKCPGRIKEVQKPMVQAEIAQELYKCINQFKDAYDAVAGILLNPHTYLGKKRLYAEFELLIE